jgi:hypothetical protein
VTIVGAEVAPIALLIVRLGFFDGWSAGGVVAEVNAVVSRRQERARGRVDLVISVCLCLLVYVVANQLLLPPKLLMFDPEIGPI